MRTRILLATTAFTALLATAGFVWFEGGRVRHLAVPILTDPSRPSGEPATLTELPACQQRQRARVAGRVTALLPASDGALWIGTFDNGVFRAAPGLPPREVGSLAGRELFTNDLAEHEGRIWVATQSGVLVLEPSGERLLPVVPDTAVTALTRIDERLYGSTSRGLVRLSLSTGITPIEIHGPFGEPVRVNALATSTETLWLGSWDGVYSLPVTALYGPPPLSARWHPLVFGSSPAQTNVVTALVSYGEGVLAGTDNGGLVRVNARSTEALRFTEPRANEVNPGAATATGATAVFGTQGGGLLVASHLEDQQLQVGRPRNWAAAQVTAVRNTEEGLLIATADGAALVVDCALGVLAQKTPSVDRVTR